MIWYLLETFTDETLKQWQAEEMRIIAKKQPQTGIRTNMLTKTRIVMQ